MKIDVCLPIKNEENIIASNIYKLKNYLDKLDLKATWQITGAINSSQDKSYQIFKEISEKHPQIRCLYLNNSGKGRAIKAAWQTSDADILVFMDIDLAVPLNFFTNLIYPLLEDDFDLSIGSRFLPNSSIKRSWQRKIMSRTYLYLAKLIFRFQQTDLQCGFKAIKRKSFLTLNKHLRDNYWFLDTELIIFAQLYGLKIKEIPVDWQERAGEKKKSNINIIKDSSCFILNLLKLRQQLFKLKKSFKNK